MKVKTRGTLRIIAGEDRGRRLTSPSDNRIRPTPGMAREAICSILQDRIPGSRFLDLYAGTGSVGLEALSRGAESVVFVESGREAVQLLRGNIAVMNRARDCALRPAPAVEQCRLFTRMKQRFDLVFVDPPYDDAGMPIRLVEPILEPDGILVFQRPERFPVGNPFHGTVLECCDTRRYGRAEFTFWRFPIEPPEAPLA